MSLDSLQGPLSPADLQAIWEGAVDQEYARPLLEAGEGGGFEVYTQAFQQIARLSEAVDYSFQQVYIQPWSGQSGEPASGASFATVQLTFARGGYVSQPLVLLAGQVVDEVQNDHSASGSVPTNTGRQYVLQENVVFFPGDPGPYTATAQAAKVGYGYNNPLPGSLSFLENDGTLLRNSLATLALNPGATIPAPPVPLLGYTLTAYDVTDMFVPDNVGQYVLFTGGDNQGAAALVARFVPPNPAASQGSGVVLFSVVSFESFDTSYGADLVVGMPVTFSAGGPTLGVGVLLASQQYGSGTGYRVVALLQQGTISGCTLMSQEHAAPAPNTNALLSIVHTDGELTPEAPSGVPLAGGSSWRVMDWAQDWQLMVTNAEQPTGGALGMLDLIGAERKLPRQLMEPDDPYRDRLWQIADVVTPNALARALYQALGQLPWCYREASNGLLPGIFYDRGLEDGMEFGGDPDGSFYDDDMLLWTGSVVFGTGQFRVGDPVVYERQVPASTGPWLLQCTGYFGGFGGAATFVAAASNGQTLPQATISVDSLVGFALSGEVVVDGDTVSYTGVNVANKQLVGCTGGTATLHTSDLVTQDAAGGNTMLFIRKTGEAFDPVAGDRIRDRLTGAVFDVTGNVPDDFAVTRRWQVYLSKQDMRGYFAVEVPLVDYGEFGCSYDNHPFGAYDAGPYLDFYDGFPAGSAPLYGKAWAALNAAKAGGVGFDLFLSSGPCV